MKPRKPKKTFIAFKDKAGRTIRLNCKMTLAELLKMGVVHVNIAQPDIPMSVNEWRSRK